jgi:phosphatidylserine/phosphatidylglycerophosphate/cardiolipin synthase-like enzyme
MPAETPPTLTDSIQAIAAGFPIELVVDAADALHAAQGLEPSRLRAQVLSAVPQPALRDRVRGLLDRWQAEAPRVTAEGLGLALSAAAHTAEHFRQQQTLELVWTGPDSQVLPLRRTDQALLELINGAQNRLIIISFAVYKATAIASALVQAARRHVAVDVCLETPDASEGKVAYDMLAALGPDVRRQASYYVWPLDKRPLSPTGHHGSLHAKVAVADGRVLLISSANLTEYAMTLNMEMGVLLRGGELPKQVELHFARLIDTGILEPVRFK